MIVKTSALALLLSTAPTIAADQYQIIPFYSQAYSGSIGMQYNTPVIDKTTEKIARCNGVINLKNPILVAITCYVQGLSDASSAFTSGVAVLGTNTMFSAAAYPAIWKIDPSGVLTLCAKATDLLNSVALQDWYCNDINIQACLANTQIPANCASH